MAKFKTMEITCDGKIIDLLNGNFSEQSIPKKGQTFSMQKIVDGEVKDTRYLIEKVSVDGQNVKCDCSFIGYS